jgi:hypothetical protein
MSCAQMAEVHCVALSHELNKYSVYDTGDRSKHTERVISLKGTETKIT